MADKQDYWFADTGPMPFSPFGVIIPIHWKGYGLVVATIAWGFGFGALANHLGSMGKTNEAVACGIIAGLGVLTFFLMLTSRTRPKGR